MISCQFTLEIHDKVWRPPEISVAPSLVKNYSDVKEFVDNNYSIASSEILLSLVEEYYVSCKVSNALVTGMLEDISRIDNDFYGGFSQENEIAYTSVLSSSLQRHYSSIVNLPNNFAVKIFHQPQLPPALNSTKNSSSDIGFFLDTRIGNKKCLYPFCFYVFTLSKIDDKRGQAVSESALFLKTIKKYENGIIGVIISPYFFECRAYFPCRDNSLSDILLFKGSSICAGDMYALLKVINSFCMQINSSLNKQCAFPLLYKNVVISETSVKKVFDYRFKECIRNPENYAGRLKSISKCYLHDSFPNGLFCIVSYDLVHGSHYPTSINHLLSLAREVLKLHNENKVHGDIRLSNLIFTADHTCVLIDFDFMSVDQNSNYPANFNLEIQDGKRHSNAYETAVMRKEHDVFSVFYIVKLCNLTSFHQVEKSENLKLSHLITWLENHMDDVVNIDRAKVPVAQTGSPNKLNDAKSQFDIKKRKDCENHSDC